MARITNKVTLLRRPQDGIQGSRGPALRGPMEWDACLPNFQFQCGAQGEPFYDIVYHDKYFYVCKVSHSKSSDSQPGPSSDYWDLFADIPFIATRILLTQYALVKNLGVECIDMKDADGNILFQAKDGNVICRTGTFENIKVSGDITAEYLNLKISTDPHFKDDPVLANGSICVQGSGILLPELPIIAKTKRATFKNETSKSSLFSLPFFSCSFDRLNTS